jgi:hypothetical protein
VRSAYTCPPTVLPLQVPTSSARQAPTPQVTEEVHERALEAPVTITKRELFLLAPEVLTKVTDVTVKKCFPHQSVLEGLMLDVLPNTLDSFSLADTFLVARHF